MQVLLGNMDNFSYIGYEPNRKVMEELWMKAKGYEDYLEVSNLGRVRSIDRTIIRSDGKKHTHMGKLKKLTKNPKGYLRVSVLDRQKNLKKGPLVHRLVAQTFIPNPENKPEVNHKDGNKSNCSVHNLEWNTSSENTQHAIDTGLMNTKLTKDDVLFIRKSNLKQKELAEMFNVNQSNISLIKNRINWKNI